MKYLIPPGELECDYVRSSGPGGQNVNKVNSKCILRWAVSSSPTLPVEIRGRFIARFGSRLTLEGVLVVTGDRYRDQKRNYEDCVAKAQALVDAVAEPPKPRKKTKPSRGSQRRRLDQKSAHGRKKAMRRSSHD